MCINFQFHFRSRGHFRTVMLYVCTKFCAKYVHPLQRYYHFTKFNMATIRHLGFVWGSRGNSHEGLFMVDIPEKILS